MDSFYHHRNGAALLSLAFLLLIPLLVYFPLLRASYIDIDDELLIIDNVKAQGVTLANVRQAFTTYDPELYIPLTILSYQVEYSLMGGWNPAVTHGISLALHLVNTVLVFFLMKILLRNIPTIPAAPTLPTLPLILALLFALHPLNVETVAWAAARKDLLSGFFFLGSLCTYLRWRDSRVTLSLSKCDTAAGNVSRATSFDRLRMTHCRPSPWYWLSLVAFLLGLLAKVSIAPLPVILLLLEKYQIPRTSTSQRATYMRLLPFFLLAILFVGIALIGKHSQNVPFATRALVPFVAIPFYLQKFFLPLNLSLFYPLPDDITFGHPSVLLGITLLTAIAVWMWNSRGRWREIQFGILWFFLMLAPSFGGSVKGGDGGVFDLYIASDRYMYLPMLGPLLPLVGYGTRRRWGVGILVLIIALFSWKTFQQERVWMNSEALFGNVVQADQASHVAYNNLAGYRARQGQESEAVELYRQSLAAKENPRALFNLGRLLLRTKDYDEAETLFTRYLHFKPRDGFAHMQLGGLLLLRSDIQSARLHVEKAVQLDPALPEAHYLLGATYERMGESAKAQQEFQETLRLKPDHPYARGKIDQETFRKK